jgi:outer membrane receptor protein involved in Fe transport
VIVFPTTGLAQDSAEEDASPSDEVVEPVQDEYVEEIIVEGTRGQGIKEVPIAVTQFGASDIQNLRIQNVADLAAYTPNLEINTSFAASNPTLFIRGVGLKDYNSNSTGAVGIWHDDIMMNSPTAQLFSIYDIESIEVLRGPVGGLRGRNATAGAIRLHSFKPSLDWDASGSFTYGNLNDIAFEGALGFPIFPETFGEMVSARVAFVTEFRDPYTDNVCANWDPTEYGLLPSTEESTRDVFAQLDPSQTQVVTSAGTSDTANTVRPRHIYRDVAAVEQYNNSEGQTALNFARLLDGPGGTPGTLVGIQGNSFRIAEDNVCLLQNAGVLTTFAGDSPRNPAGSFRANRNAHTLEDFQGLQEKYNDVKYWGTRAQLLFQPTDTMDFLAKFQWGQNRSDSLHLQSVGVRPGKIGNINELITEPLGYTESANAAAWSEVLHDFAPFEGRQARNGLRPQEGSTREGAAGDDPFSGFYSSDGLEKLDLYGGSLNGNFEFDWGRIEAISGFESAKRSIDDEGDGCPCTPLAALIDDDTWQVTEEVNATLEGDGYWVKFGAFYIHEDLNSRNFFQQSLRFALDQEYEQTTDAANIGADFHYDFFEEDVQPGLWQLSLDGGVRYNYERKKFTLGTTFEKLNTGASRDTIPKETVIDTWDAPTGELTLSYKPLEEARLYIKYTRAFKAGHFNAGITTQPDPQTGLDAPMQSLDPVKPEYVDAVEFGLKSTWLDDRVELSGAIFRYWYQDLQVFDIVNEAGSVPTQQLLNADADVLGAEIELTLRPIDGLMFSGGFGWIDSEFGEFIVSKVITPPTGIPSRPGESARFNYEGNPLIAAPEYSASGYLEYELPLSRWGSLIPSSDFSWKSQTYLDAQQEELISQDAFWLFNARLAYRTPDGSIEIAGWVQNFMDETYKTEAFDESRQYGHILEIWGEPRTYGFTISYHLSAE